MALTAPNTWTFRPRGAGMDCDSFLVQNAEVIYNGAIVVVDKALGVVSPNEGTLKNLDDLSGTLDWVVGLARPSTNYVTGDGSTVWCPVDTSGPTIVHVSVAGVTSAKTNGDLVYATDENTLTLTPSTYVKAIGVQERYYGTTYIDVKMFNQMEAMAYLRG
jgi:hypothetical protein